jgi:hypoxanthine-guanine phosphoribosyltransferase
MRPVRIPLFGFPDVVLHADELAVKKSPYYSAAKGGDADAADLLVADMIQRDCTTNLMMPMRSRQARLLPIHALEAKGVNEIPAAMAKLLSGWLGFPVETSIVQANTVGHTGASGFQRLANQACFVGEVERGEQYLIVDDFVGQGGTLANLIGYIESQGGHAAGATVLTGKPYSAMLAPDDLHIQALRDKHGREFEDWWRETFGFGFDCLTRSEARYLENSPDAQTIRDRLAAAGLESRSGPTAR